MALAPSTGFENSTVTKVLSPKLPTDVITGGVVSASTVSLAAVLIAMPWELVMAHRKSAPPMPS